jgi:3D (Asp-Asp-Asp) domain-containing protein
MLLLVTTLSAFSLSFKASNVKTYRANISAYCTCERCCEKWSKYRTTASGHKIKKGDRFVAMPREIPFHSTIEIPSYNNGKSVPVLDRGGAIKGNKIDVFFDSHSDALKFGRRYETVKLTLKEKK